MSIRFSSSDEMRSQFSRAISDVYRSEVPLYGTLLEIVSEVNGRSLDETATLKAKDGAGRIEIERHGAIRIGKPEELAMLRRVFLVMGMYPVGYYDLSEAGIPVHSTAFRPVSPGSLDRNPFRMFTSLLRLELIADSALREKAESLLAQRRIFSDVLVKLVNQYERDGGLDHDQANVFVEEVVEMFRWHSDVSVATETYHALNAAHRLIADVVCFRGPHINHLTPRTVDIDAVQQAMIDHGIDAKAVIEGPPRRNVPILLRQTSFKAMNEPLRFVSADRIDSGIHSARFGEVEQRGMALTPKGRNLYDQLLREARATTGSGADGTAFDHFPDDERILRTQSLGYFLYQWTDGVDPREVAAEKMSCVALASLVDEGLVVATPLTYEDFLPVSAAGIFQSNIGAVGTAACASIEGQEAFELALGCRVLDPFSIYAEMEEASIRALFSRESTNQRMGRECHPIR